MLANNRAFDPVVHTWGIRRHGVVEGYVQFYTPQVHLIGYSNRYEILHELVGILIPEPQFAHVRRQLQSILSAQIQASRRYANDIIEEEAPSEHEQFGGMHLSF